VSSSQQSQ
jgi:hypothetical protein